MTFQGAEAFGAAATVGAWRPVPRSGRTSSPAGTKQLV